MLRNIRDLLSKQEQSSEIMRHAALIYFSFFLLNLLKCIVPCPLKARTV
jgi:hypothetical protein